MPKRRIRRRKKTRSISFSSEYLPSIVTEFIEYLLFLRMYFRGKLFQLFSRFEKQKDRLVDVLYRRRGKYARPFVHTSLMGLLVVMLVLGPFLFTNSAFSSDLERGTLPSSVVLGINTMENEYSVGTMQSKTVAAFRGGEITEYTVKEGDTVSVIAEKFNITAETILWANDLDDDDTLKVGQKLDILPVTGVMHTVKKGETIYTIAKKYGLDGDAGAQAIVDYPFNEFINDEKFTIAIGQTVVVPGGSIPEKTKSRPSAPTYFASTTPDRGTVSAVGSFVWPASGRITQGYSFYHKAIDIANKSGGSILAADAGVVTVSGWPDNYGYGNRVMVDHQNGYVTLYAHLSSIGVRVGQSVNRGDVLGQMGTTGRSTGVHLHFEIRRSGGLENPLSHLQ